MQSFVWVHAEEAEFTFCRVNWEMLFQDHFFEVVEAFWTICEAFDGSGEEDQIARPSA